MLLVALKINMIEGKLSNYLKSFILVKSKGTLLFSTAFIIRVIFLFYLPNNSFPDSLTYINAGKDLFNLGAIKFDNVMPIYPIYTYLIGSEWAIKWVDIIISSINVLLIYRLSELLYSNNKLSLISGSIATFYPFFIFYSVSILTETLYIFFVLLIFISFYKKWFIAASIFIILSILLRPIFDLLSIPLIIFFSYFYYNSGILTTVRRIVYYILLYILLMLPWWIHQYNKYGELVRLNLGDGIVLYSGNNPLNKSGGGVLDPIKGPDMDMSFFNSIVDPIEKNKQMKTKAFEYIKSNPVHFFKMMGIKFIRFWRLWPYSPQYEKPLYMIASIFSYGICLLLSIGFLFTIKFADLKKITPIFMVISYLCLIHMVTISSIRYRLPIEPFLIIFASKFLFNLKLKIKFGYNFFSKFLAK
jgi:uncharacterized membrane protein YvlD (DUF360 family)